MRETEIRCQAGTSRGLADRLFAIDVRTLALFRMLMAAVLIFDIGGRLRDAAMMYGPDGVMPQDLVQTTYYASGWNWSLYFLNSSLWFQELLLFGTLVVAVLLGLGWKTRLQTILAWILVVSLHQRGPLLVTGGDVLLSLLLLWSIFLPLGATWSIDSRGGPKRTGRHLSVASGMILLQMAIMYFYTGVSKSNDVWFAGAALANIYEYDLVTRPLGRWLLQFPLLLQWATWATLALELVGPLLMFSPWRTALLRRWTVAAFFFLHVAIESTMRVIVFSFVSMTGLSLFVSSDFWESKWGRRLASWLDRAFGLTGEGTEAATPRGVFPLPRWVNAGVAILALVIFAINVPFLWKGGRFVHEMPKAAKRVGELLACVQRWDMFATPRFGDFRMVAIGTRPDGTEIDLLRDGTPVRLEDPDDLRTTARTPRWLGLYYDLARNDQYLFRRPFARYLMRQWNRGHRADDQVEFVQLVLLVRPKLEWVRERKRTYPPDYAFIMVPEDQRDSRRAWTVVLDVYDPLVEGTYVNGFKEGLFIVRHANGRKASEGRYHRGVPAGEWTYWDESGHLEGRGVYRDGEMDGRWELYFDGRREEVWFHRGRPIPPPTSQGSTVGLGSDRTVAADN